jgi:hypothetical protein
MATLSSIQQAAATSAGVGGGGAQTFAQHYNSGAFLLKTVTSLDTFEDLVSLQPATSFQSGDEVIFKLETTVGCYNTVGGASRGVIGLFDYNDNPIALAYFGTYLLASITAHFPVSIEGRYTFTEVVGTPIFKIKIKNLDAPNNQVSAGYTDWTGSGTGPEVTNKFWAYRNI